MMSMGERRGDKDQGQLATFKQSGDQGTPLNVSDHYQLSDWSKFAGIVIVISDKDMMKSPQFDMPNP